MTTTYEKTDDPNVIKQTRLVVDEIHLDKLKKQITDLEKEMDAFPQLIEKGAYPDCVLLLIDEHNVMIPDITETQSRLDKKKELLSKLEKL